MLTYCLFIKLQEAIEREKEEAKQRELQRQLDEAREKERKRLEEEERKRLEMERKMRSEEAIKRRLQQLSPCPAGFSWHKVRKASLVTNPFISDKILTTQ